MPGDFFGLSGHAIDGQFHAIEVAGEGGFSVVYRGMHLTMREPIAIKCLKIQVKSNNPAVVKSFTQRFFDESRIMYRLSQGNLNIVRAITTGVTVSPSTKDPVPYMVLEWLDGVSMSKHMKDARAKKAPPPSLKAVIDLFEPAALAIAYAHSQGVVHRDVKPGNLFLQNTREGAPRMKVLDFGMAKVLAPENMGGLESAETLANVMVVSPQYVTPEQLDKAWGTIGPWTDVYAFALILVEALTNRRARDAESFADLMVQITKAGTAPTPLARGAVVSDAVNDVFERAFARKPTDRQPDLGAFWRDLKAAAASQMKAEEEDLRTYIDMPVLQGTLALPPQQPKADFSKTLPLQTASTGAGGLPGPRPAAGRRAFSGTMPMQSVEQTASRDAAMSAAARYVPPSPEPSGAKAPTSDRSALAALEAVRPSVATGAAPQLQQQPQLQPIPVLSPEPSRDQTTARKPRPQPIAPPKPRANRVLVAFLLLFVLASLGASGLILANIFLFKAPMLSTPSPSLSPSPTLSPSPSPSPSPPPSLSPSSSPSE